MLPQFKRTLILIGLGLVSIIQGKDLPNILWLTSEDNSPFLGCYGDELAHSPNIDRLAKDGIIFKKAYSNAAVCSPCSNDINSWNVSNLSGRRAHAK